MVLSCKGMKPFGEFNLIGKTIKCVTSGTTLSVISKTVRCKGVSVDPLDNEIQPLDIPKLLMDHFPEQGPFLGVYCRVVIGGTLSIGDSMSSSM